MSNVLFPRFSAVHDFYSRFNAKMIKVSAPHRLSPLSITRHLMGEKGPAGLHHDDFYSRQKNVKRDISKKRFSVNINFRSLPSF